MTPRNITPDESQAISRALAAVLGLPVADEHGFGPEPIVLGESPAPHPAAAPDAAAPSSSFGVLVAHCSTRLPRAPMPQIFGGRQ